ncbi:MAG: KamA family radical SAM protein [Planctomycetota bacterium]
MPSKYVSKLKLIEQLSEDEKLTLAPVEQKFVFRANDYYLGLIDWDDENDPIRRLIIPHEKELVEWGKLDASDEQSNTVAPGVQHKYVNTVLLLCNDVCGAYCRYCFRKRLFMDDSDETTRDVSAGIQYIREHEQVTDVLLTGGDPLLMTPKRLADILAEIYEIDHIRVIRMGSKIPAFDPARLLTDKFLDVMDRYADAGKKIYLMAHFDHPRELTSLAREAIAELLKRGVAAVNQCPLIRGVNDSSDVLAELYEELAGMGCRQYYLFQGRPTEGNMPYELPITTGWHLHQEAVKQVSGLGRTARFSMSHDTGKIEIVGVDDNHIYLRYHQAKDPAQQGQFMVAERDDNAYWFDQLNLISACDSIQLESQETVLS